MADSFEEFCVKVKAFIEEGAIAEAQAYLTANESKYDARPERLELAHFFRRSRLPEKAISLLRPYIRPNSKKPFVATDQEKLAYSAALTLLDASKECRKLLESVKDKNADEYLLFSSFNLIREWNYSEAAGFLEKYIAQIHDDYKKAIGTVNLLQCYLASEELDKAHQIISQKWLENFLLEQSKHRLLGNYYELTAQYYFQTKDWNLAGVALKNAQKYSQQNKSIDELFVKKWDLLVDMYKTSDKTKIEARWIKMRKKAHSFSHFETARDLDCHFSLRFRDDEILRYVYWGTPYKSYKNKIKKKYKDFYSVEFDPGQNFRRKIFEHQETFPFGPDELPIVEFKLESFRRDPRFSRDILVFRLLEALCSDFYKVSSLYYIFEFVYEGEFFNPESSPGKIRQLVFRLKESFRELDLPLTVSFGERGYWLEVTEDKVVHIDLASKFEIKRHEQLLEKIEELFAKNSFKAKDLSSEVSMSARTVATALKDLLEDGAVEKIGSGPNTSYRLV